MEKRQLGKNGPMVSAIGLGCMSFAGFYGATDEAESHATLAFAIDMGIDFLDTANIYGNGVSEKAIGSFLKQNPHEFTIATKGGIYRNPETNARGFNNSPEHLRAELEKSLTRLGVEHVALYYIHRRDHNFPIEDVMETLVRFKDEGKIGGIGFSEISPSSLRRAHAVYPVMAVQSEYSLWTRVPELGVIQTCKELGVAFVPFSPLGRGMFADKTLDVTGFGDMDFRKNSPRFMEPNFSANVKALVPFKKMASDMGTTTASLAMAWVLAQGDFMIPIPGTRTVKHFREDVDAAALKLSADDLAKIEEILPIGWAHGDRYSDIQLIGAERYC
ncbi:MAG: aldo/keto reductase [Rhizobiaceae bacterium]